MKKIFIMLIVIISSYTLFAQTEMTDSSGTKTKVKTKTNDDGVTKTKTKTTDADMDDSKTKTKTKTKPGDADNMQNGTMNTSGMNNGTMNSSTSTTMVTIGGWTTNPPSLPVIGNNVPADAVTAIKNKYGATVYDIKQIKSTSGQDIYIVRIMDNGQIKTEYVGADGNTVPQ